MNAQNLQRVPGKAVQKQNPFKGDAKAERAGVKLYSRECASCHGANRQGRSKAPPLLGPEIHDAPSGALFWVLTHGSLRRGMPSFPHLPEARRVQTIPSLHVD